MWWITWVDNFSTLQVAYPNLCEAGSPETHYTKPAELGRHRDTLCGLQQRCVPRVSPCCVVGWGWTERAAGFQGNVANLAAGGPASHSEGFGLPSSPVPAQPCRRSPHTPGWEPRFSCWGAACSSAAVGCPPHGMLSCSQSSVLVLSWVVCIGTFRCIKIKLKSGIYKLYNKLVIMHLVLGFCCQK